MNDAKITTIKPGYWIAASLKPNTAPLRCYVGQVQAVDDLGVRLTLVDWLSGLAAMDDIFIPWHNLESALIATEDHDKTHFGDAAIQWQNQMCGTPVETESAQRIGTQKSDD